MDLGRLGGWRRPTAAAGILLACGGPLVDALAGGRVMGTAWSTVAAAVAGFLIGAWMPPAAAALICLAGAGALTAANQLVQTGRYSVANDFFFFGLVVGGLALAGALLAARRTQVVALRDLATLRTGQIETEVRAAQVEERNRLETEVTRAVMQRIGALVVQAAGARRGTDRAAVHRAVGQLELGGRRVLDELRDVVGTLRGASADDARDRDDPEPAVRVEHRLGWVDLVVAASGLPLAVELTVGSPTRGPLAADVLAAAAVGLPLLVRRSHPVGAAAGMAVVAVAVSASLTPLGPTVTILLPASLAAYAIGAHARRWARLAGVAVLVLGGAALTAAAPGPTDGDIGLVPTLAWLAVAVLSGAVAAQYAARTVELRRLIVLTESGRGAQLRLAVAQQRESVARDLHDTIAAAMTVVCLHAGAAQQHHDDNRAVADALATIEAAAREAMVQLRCGLEVLEDEGNDLVAELNGFAGLLALRPTITVDRPLLPDERVLARRVVRETLVNIARHAPGSSAVARVRDEAGHLVVEVVNSPTDDGRPSARSGTGTGLIGLGELLGPGGGRLEHGPTADGGFRVAAYLPLAPGPR